MKHFEITEQSELEALISRIKICHLSMVDGDMPYVVPMNFSYKDNYIYLHSGQGGRKLDILRNKNNKVCISMEADSEMYIRHEQVACSYSMKFQSIIISGEVEFIDDLEGKEEALNIFMGQYTDRGDFKYGIPALKGVDVMRVKIENISGRKRGY